MSKKEMEAERGKWTYRTAEGNMEKLPQTVKFPCRSIRIGSFNAHGSDESSYLTVSVYYDGFSFEVPTVTDGETSVTITLDKMDISRVYFHLTRYMSILFIQTTIACASSIRQKLNMLEGNPKYFDPESPDVTQKRITFLIENVEPVVHYKCLWSSFMKQVFPGERYVTELKSDEANLMLTKSTPKQLNYSQSAPYFPPRNHQDQFATSSPHISENNSSSCTENSPSLCTKNSPSLCTKNSPSLCIRNSLSSCTENSLSSCTENSSSSSTESNSLVNYFADEYSFFLTHLRQSSDLHLTVNGSSSVEYLKKEESPPNLFNQCITEEIKDEVSSSSDELCATKRFELDSNVNKNTKFDYFIESNANDLQYDCFIESDGEDNMCFV